MNLLTVLLKKIINFKNNKNNYQNNKIFYKERVHMNIFHNKNIQIKINLNNFKLKEIIMILMNIWNI